MNYFKYMAMILGFVASVLNGASPLDQLISAVTRGNLAEVQSILAGDCKLDINKPNRYGQTALHKAVWYRHNAVIELLFSKGANINQFTPAGTTLLMEAAIMGDRRMVTLLLSHGADADIVDSEGRKAADLARLHNNHALGGMIPIYATQAATWQRRRDFVRLAVLSARVEHRHEATAASDGSLE